MENKVNSLTLHNISYQVIHQHVLIIGSGAASLSCAVHMKRMGCDDILIVTDNINGGTSRNTGSDKQTYYKLSLIYPRWCCLWRYCIYRNTKFFKSILQSYLIRSPLPSQYIWRLCWVQNRP